MCNAAESLLVHAAVAAEFVPRVVEALQDAGVTVHGDEAFQRQDGRRAGHRARTSTTEYLSLDIAAAVVPSLDGGGRPHPRATPRRTPRRSSPRDRQAARRFTAAVDSAAVMVNASTRFTDGGEFGFGAEIGISTQKLHARGPMGLPEMTSTKYVVTGDGHTR